MKQLNKKFTFFVSTFAFDCKRKRKKERKKTKKRVKLVEMMNRLALASKDGVKSCDYHELIYFLKKKMIIKFCKGKTGSKREKLTNGIY